MRAINYKILVAAMMLALAAGCATRTPVQNVSGAPVETNKRNVSMDDVSKAIVRAGATLGWEMRPVRPGLVVGTLHLRKHTAVVEIPYTTQTYSINYKESKNLDYDGNTIHKNYNSWVENLSKQIRIQLATL